MFGIGLPEMIVIFVVALIVVGPDKLPELAKSLAKGLREMKEAVNQVKDNLTEESETISSVQKDLHDTADGLKKLMLEADADSSSPSFQQDSPPDNDVIDISNENLRPWEKEAVAAPQPSDESLQPTEATITATPDQQDREDHPSSSV